MIRSSHWLRVIAKSRGTTYACSASLHKNKYVIQNAARFVARLMLFCVAAVSGETDTASDSSSSSSSSSSSIDAFAELMMTNLT